MELRLHLGVESPQTIDRVDIESGHPFTDVATPGVNNPLSDADLAQAIEPALSSILALEISPAANIGKITCSLLESRTIGPLGDLSIDRTEKYTSIDEIFERASGSYR